MGDFLRIVLEKLYEVWPLRVVRSYQKGVPFWLGEVGEEKGAGVYAFVPFFGAFEIVDVVEDVIDLPSQSITTKDGKMVTFSANVSFEVVDAVALWTQVQDFGENLSRVACGHLALKIREWTWDELQEGQRKLELSLRDTLTTRVKPWGVRVLECRLTDCVQAKQFRLIP